LAGKPKHLQAFLLGFILFLIPTAGRSATLLQIVLLDFKQVIWERPISPEEHFYLIHRNSIYDALVWEAFSVDPEGLIWLRRIKTTSPAVLEYYGLEDTSSDWIGLSRKIGRIPLIITSLGEVRLELGKEKVPLSALLPEGTLIEVKTHTSP
jgi:hypothetical protein